MENATDLSLSPSERRTLQHLLEGELHTTELDWVALHRLKRLALAEERNGGWGITKEAGGSFGALRCRSDGAGFRCRVWPAKWPPCARVEAKGPS